MKTLDTDKLNVELERLRLVDTKLRRYSLEAKLELCRKVAHTIDTRLGEQAFVYSTFSDVSSSTYHDLRSTVHLFELDYLSNVSTVKGEWEGSLKSKFTLKEFRQIINSLKAYSPPFIHSKDQEQKDISLDLFLTRTALQQFLYQWHPLIHLYRYNYLFNYKSDSFDVKEMFEQTFGFSFNDFVKFSTALFLLSKNTAPHPLTREQVLNELGKGRTFQRDTVIKLINVLSMDRETAISKYDEYKSEDERMKVYNYNPYVMKPILLKDDNLYIPIPQLLFPAITQGFYHMLCYKYRHQNFRANFGKFAFEDYINQVFCWQSGYEVIPEFKYLKGKNKLDSPDFILVQKNEIILVEVKATAPKIQLREADVQTYKEELHKSYGVAIAQCVKKENHIKEGLIKHPKLPEHIERIYYLIVTFEEFYIMNTEKMRLSIAEYCEKEGCLLPEDKKFHIVSSVTLEQIIETDQRSLFEFLKLREEDKEIAYADIAWTSIQESSGTKKIRAIDFWENEMEELSESMFGSVENSD